VSDRPGPPLPDLPGCAKTQIIDAWAALRACPFPRLIVSDQPLEEESAT